MTTFFLLSHNTAIEGASDYLEDFLLRKENKIIKLSHPLDSYSEKKTILSVNKEVRSKIRRIDIGILNLIVDFLISQWYLLSNQFDTFIGANNFDTLAGIFARKILRKKINKIIYFASDFSEDRFQNSLLNKIYLYIEKISLIYSDITISNTKRALLKRIELGLRKEKGVVIPNGVHLNDPVFIPKEILKSNFIYVGSITKEHGLYEILYEISSKIKELIIIGSGNDLIRVKELCERKKINFKLFQNQHHSFVIEYLQKFDGIGLAPYNLEEKWTYYCSPLKVNEYIACGVPVIISDVPEIAEYISTNNLGIIYEQNKMNEIVNKLDAALFNDFHIKSSRFYSQFNFDSLFDRAIIF